MPLVMKCGAPAAVKCQQMAPALEAGWPLSQAVRQPAAASKPLSWPQHLGPDPPSETRSAFQECISATRSQA